MIGNGNNIGAHQRELVIQTNEQQLKTEKLSITANAFKQDKLCTARVKGNCHEFIMITTCMCSLRLSLTCQSVKESLSF